MHRKWFWCLAAVGVAAVGVGYWTGEYACDHPNSWVARCFVTAHHVAVTDVRAVAATRQTAEVAVQRVQGMLVKGPAGSCNEEPHCAVPEAAPEVVVMQPAILPGAVIINVGDEVDALPVQPMPPVHEIGMAEESEAVMPRAEDDAPKMPPAEEMDDDCCRPAPMPDKKPALAPMPECKDDDCRHGAHHGVPATIKGRDVPGGNEECEPAAPKMHCDGGEKPKHPEVDTMEVRPSDMMFWDCTGPF